MGISPRLLFGNCSRLLLRPFLDRMFCCRYSIIDDGCLFTHFQRLCNEYGYTCVKIYGIVKFVFLKICATDWKVIVVYQSKLQSFLTKPFFLFSIILLIKSVIAWFVIFEGGPSWSTMFKELSVILLAFVLVEWFASKSKLTIYLLVNLLLTCIFFAAIMYYKYYGVIVTYHALAQVNQVGTVKTSIFTLLDPYFLLIFVDIIILAAIIFRKKGFVQRWKQASAERMNRVALTTVFATCLILIVSLIMPNRFSMNEIVKAEQMGILNYELYTIFAEVEPTLVKADQITQRSIDELKGIQRVDDPKLWQAAQGKNLILIQMESLQNFVLNLEIDGQEITPVLNELAREHFYFPHFYQQVGQGNTSDAEFVVNTSSYIPPRGAATQVYGDKELPSLAKLLQQHGYETATFHTNDVEFWNRDELYDALGFQHIYDKAYFGEEDVLFFGASDEVLYPETAYALEQLADKGRPFYAHVISMSSHHPFTLPEDKIKIELPERYEDTLVGDYLTAQHYSDYALGIFIEDLKARGLWEDSLIVLYGDHLGLPLYSLDRDDEQLLEEIYNREYTYTDMINIPFIVVSDDMTYPQVQEQLGGQVDILPTIANLLGVSLEGQLHFGQDLFNYTEFNILPQRYYLPSGSLVSGEELFLSGAGYEDGEHLPLTGNGIDTTPNVSEEDFNRALALLHLSDSYVQQLPTREE